MKSFQLLLLIRVSPGWCNVCAPGEVQPCSSRFCWSMCDRGISPTGAQEANHRHALPCNGVCISPRAKVFLESCDHHIPGSRIRMARFRLRFPSGPGWVYPRRPSVKYTRDTYEGDLVTGPSDPSLTLMPLTAHFRWFPTTSPQHRLRPFIGAGIGVQYASYSESKAD